MRQFYKILRTVIAVLMLCTFKGKDMNCSDDSDFMKGTLIMAGIADDGVVIAADSRATQAHQLPNGGINVFQYNDSCQKIFVIRGCPIAIAGNYKFGNATMPQ
jgi:hypothetical protein